MKKDIAREIVQATMQYGITYVVDDQYLMGDYPREIDRQSEPVDRYDDRRLHHTTARPKVVASRPKNRARW